MGKIVAIGGGSMEERETLAIDREVVRLTGSRRPRALLIPTASYDNPERYDVFQNLYGGEKAEPWTGPNAVQEYLRRSGALESVPECL